VLRELVERLGEPMALNLAVPNVAEQAPEPPQLVVEAADGRRRLTGFSFAGVAVMTTPAGNSRFLRATAVSNCTGRSRMRRLTRWWRC
jgi:hypothetical protein